MTWAVHAGSACTLVYNSYELVYERVNGLVSSLTDAERVTKSLKVVTEQIVDHSIYLGNVSTSCEHASLKHGLPCCVHIR